VSGLLRRHQRAHVPEAGREAAAGAFDGLLPLAHGLGGELSFKVGDDGLGFAPGLAEHPLGFGLGFADYLALFLGKGFFFFGELPGEVFALLPEEADFFLAFGEVAFLLFEGGEYFVEFGIVFVDEFLGAGNDGRVEAEAAGDEEGFATAWQADLQPVGRPQGVYVKFYAGVFDSMPA
jgi:hypothetical protein